MEKKLNIISFVRAFLDYLMHTMASFPIASTEAGESEDAIHTITGAYSFIGNPCVTRPCLPGMVYAVISNHKSYYITINGSFLSDNLSYRGYSPEPGALVAVKGYLSSHKDIYGNAFYKIEVVSIQPYEQRSHE